MQISETKETVRFQIKGGQRMCVFHAVLKLCKISGQDKLEKYRLHGGSKPRFQSATKS